MTTIAGSNFYIGCQIIFCVVYCVDVLATEPALYCFVGKMAVYA